MKGFLSRRWGVRLFSELIQTQNHNTDPNHRRTIKQPKLQHPRALNLSKLPVVYFENQAHHDVDLDHAHLKVIQILLNGLNFD